MAEPSIVAKGLITNNMLGWSLEELAGDKCSSLFCPCISDKEE
jgi:hypothetical protein